MFWIATYVSGNVFVILRQMRSVTTSDLKPKNYEEAHTQTPQGTRNR